MIDAEINRLAVRLAELLTECGWDSATITADASIELRKSAFAVDLNAVKFPGVNAPPENPNLTP